MDEKKDINENLCIAISTIKGILATKRFLLLMKPDFISLDTKEKKILVNNKKKYAISFDDVLNIELVSSKRCVDVELDTAQGVLEIKCLDIDLAIKIRDLINVHLWERIHKKNNLYANAF